MRLSVTGTSIFSRSTVMLRESSAPGLNTSSSTLLPAGPLIRPVASSELTPAIERPSTDRIRSPFAMPAALAGESSKTVRTLSPRWSSSTVMPTPSNSPEIDSCTDFASSGVR